MSTGPSRARAGLPRLRGPALTRSNRVALFNRNDEHAAVAELSSPSVIDHRLHDVVDEFIGSDDFELAHRDIPLILHAAKVTNRASTLSTPANVGHSYARNAETLECTSGIWH